LHLLRLLPRQPAVHDPVRAGGRFAERLLAPIGTWYPILVSVSLASKLPGVPEVRQEGVPVRENLSNAIPAPTTLTVFISRGDDESS
jgi:hypothetical protein